MAQIDDIITQVSQGAGTVLEKAGEIGSAVKHFEALGYHLPNALTQADFTGSNSEMRLLDFQMALGILRTLLGKFQEPMNLPDGTPLLEPDGTPTTPEKVLYRIKGGRGGSF